MDDSEIPEICLTRRDPLVIGNNIHYSSSDWTLTEKELEKAAIELGEEKAERQRCLQELKIKLSEEGNYRTDDEFLLRFLRVRKYDFTKSYQNVKNFYKVRRNNFDLFGSPPLLPSLKVFDGLACLPYADEEGRLFFWMNFENWKPQELSYEDFMKPMSVVSEIGTMNPRCQVNGVIGIWDMNALTYRRASEMMMKNRLFNFISIVYLTLPWRIKKLLVLNAGRTTRFLYNISRPLLKAKIIERIFLLGSDLKELHKHVKPELLPKALGGNLDDEMCRDPKYILDNIPYLKYDRSFTGE